MNEKQIAERVQGLHHHPRPEGLARSTPREGMVHIPAANATPVVDPTGCGDAYRAGLIFGLMNGMDLATTGRIASLMGALKIEHLGPQNQRFDLRRVRRAVPPAVRVRVALSPVATASQCKKPPEGGFFVSVSANASRQRRRPSLSGWPSRVKPLAMTYSCMA